MMTLLASHTDHAADHRRRLQEAPVVVHRIVRRQVVAQADDVVVQTVRRRGVDQPGAGVQRHVLAEDDRAPCARRTDAISSQTLEGLARGRSPEPRRSDRSAAGMIAQILGQHQQALGRAHQVVVEVRVHGHRLVGRQRPRRRRPDHRERRLVDVREAKRPRELAQVSDRERDVDGRRGAVFVLDLGLGQRRAAVDAPVHRLGALVQIAALVDRAPARG